MNVSENLIKQAESFFTLAGNTKKYLKAGFLGFGGSGKSRTASELAIGLWERINTGKPIVFYDTETGHKFLAPLFEKRGIKLMVKESRSMADLKTCMDYCRRGYADILIAESITHVWENFLEAYKKRTNKKYLSMADWGLIKPQWREEFSFPFVFDNYHMIICGRAGDEYSQVYNEDTDKTEAVVTGVKMRAEKETAFEPDITIYMERFEQIINEQKNERKIWRTATVQKGRYSEIDGKSFVNPTYKDFAPVIEFLLSKPSESKLNETDAASLFETDDRKREYMKRKEIALAEIKAEMVSKYPSTTGSDKKAKIDLLKDIFNAASWEKVETLTADELEIGLASIKSKFESSAISEQQNGND